MGELLSDQARFLRDLRGLRRDRRRGLMDPGFRERIMLAHTYVNECRYCSWAHTRAALRAGVPEDHVEDLLCGAVDSCPDEEGTALLYAIHFAETDGSPDAGARKGLDREYGTERADAIDRTLQAIRSGNLIGNSFDYLLWRISGGRLGNKGHLVLEGPG